MIPDEPSREQMRETLWAAYVKPYVDEEVYERDRHEAALKVLAATGLIAADEPSRTQSGLGLLTSGYIILSLLIADIAPWLMKAADLDGMHSDQTTGAQRRIFLKWLLILSNGGLPGNYGGSLDPAVVVLPRALLAELLCALEALGRGETFDILQPDRSGRHDAAWTWDEMRVRAVEHAHFLTGQGVQKKISLTRVGVATAVSADTIRKWEHELKQDAVYAERMSRACKAGQLLIRITDDPDAWSAELPVDLNELCAMRELKAEDLKDFGQSYRNRFGSRHNQSDQQSGGD